VTASGAIPIKSVEATIATNIIDAIINGEIFELTFELPIKLLEKAFLLNVLVHS
jgi:hypothetical protein